MKERFWKWFPSPTYKHLDCVEQTRLGLPESLVVIVNMRTRLSLRPLTVQTVSEQLDVRLAVVGWLCRPVTASDWPVVEGCVGAELLGSWMACANLAWAMHFYHQMSRRHSDHWLLSGSETPRNVGIVSDWHWSLTGRDQATDHCFHSLQWLASLCPSYHAQWSRAPRPEKLALSCHCD